MGNVWCSSCQQRHDLINWGKAHEWPSVFVDPYAIERGHWFWNMVAIAGRNEAIETIMDGLRRVPDEEVGA